MLNTTQWNAGLYGGSGIGYEVFSTDFIVANALSLSDNVSIVCVDYKESMAQRDIDETPVPLADGSHLNSMYERSKIIKSYHQLTAVSGVALEEYIDTLKKNITVQELNLDITHPSRSARRYIATLRNPEAILEDRERWDVDTSPLVLEWLCHEGFGTDRAYTTAVDSFTSSPDTTIVENTGTAKAKPVYVCVFSAATSITALQIGSDTSGANIKYTGTINAGDALVFDGETQQVTLNGTAVTFTGSFVDLLIGFNTLRVTVTGTSFTMAMTVKWKRRWR